MELLLSDGVVEELRPRYSAPAKPKKAKSAKAGVTRSGETEPATLSAQGEALAARLREWRAGEAKRLGVPAYVVLHDRSLAALALARPVNPRELLEIDGIGPGKVERFGAAILGLCAAQE